MRCINIYIVFFSGHQMSQKDNINNPPKKHMDEACSKCLPSGYVKIAIEHGHRNSEFSIVFPLKMVMFHSFPIKNGDVP